MNKIFLLALVTFFVIGCSKTPYLEEDPDVVVVDRIYKGAQKTQEQKRDEGDDRFFLRGQEHLIKSFSVIDF